MVLEFLPASESAASSIKKKRSVPIGVKEVLEQ